MARRSTAAASPAYRPPRDRGGGAAERRMAGHSRTSGGRRRRIGRHVFIDGSARARRDGTNPCGGRRHGAAARGPARRPQGAPGDASRRDRRCLVRPGVRAADRAADRGRTGRRTGALLARNDLRRLGVAARHVGALPIRGRHRGRRRSGRFRGPGRAPPAAAAAAAVAAAAAAAAPAAAAAAAVAAAAEAAARRGQHRPGPSWRSPRRHRRPRAWPGPPAAEAVREESAVAPVVRLRRAGWPMSPASVAGPPELPPERAPSSPRRRSARLRPPRSAAAPVPIGRGAGGGSRRGSRRNRHCRGRFCAGRGSGGRDRRRGRCGRGLALHHRLDLVDVHRDGDLRGRRLPGGGGGGRALGGDGGAAPGERPPACAVGSERAGIATVGSMGGVSSLTAAMTTVASIGSSSSLTARHGDSSARPVGLVLDPGMAMSSRPRAARP